MCIYVCTPVCSCPQRPEGDLGSLGAAVTGPVSPSIWVLRTKLWHSVRAARILNCWAISPVRKYSFYGEKIKRNIHFKKKRKFIFQIRITHSLKDKPWGTILVKEIAKISLAFLPRKSERRNGELRTQMVRNTKSEKMSLNSNDRRRAPIIMKLIKP